MITSAPLNIPELRLKLHASRYEADGERIHRRMTSVVEKPSDYRRRHICTKGSFQFKHVDTGRIDKVSVGAVWPFDKFEGALCDVAADTKDSTYICVVSLDIMKDRIEHSTETVAVDGVVRCENCIAVRVPVSGEPTVTICEQKKDISVVAGDKLVRFFAVPI